MSAAAKHIISESVKKFLRKPYPFYFTKDNLWAFFAIIFLIPFLFSYFFEPFEVNRGEHKMSYFWICFLHALSPTVISLIYFFVLNYFIKSYEEWTVGKEFLHIAIVLLLIGIGSFLLRDIIYNNPNNWSWQYFIEEIRNTFLVGILIMAIAIPINYSLLLQKHIKSAQIIKEKKREPLIVSSAKLIQTQVKADEFELQPNDLIAVRSDGNYSEFFINSNNSVIKLLKRISLKELELQLSEFPQLIKTHRGWLVNLDCVTQTTGNAGGYQITLAGFPKKVPVSRSMISQFNERTLTLNTYKSLSLKP